MGSTGEETQLLQCKTTQTGGLKISIAFESCYYLPAKASIILKYVIKHYIDNHFKFKPESELSSCGFLVGNEKS